MQSDPGTSELSQVFDANSRRIDFNPPWLNGSGTVIEWPENPLGWVLQETKD